MFNNWVLSYSSSICSSGFGVYAVPKGENVLEPLVLKGIRVNVNQAIGGCNS